MSIDYNDELEFRINYICKKLQYSTTSFQILNWLNNFDEADYDLALKLLEVVTYFSESDMYDSYKKLFCDLYNTIGKDKKIYIMPIGDIGKSGVYMLYYVRKALESSEDYPYQFLLTDVDLKKLVKDRRINENSIIVLVDDFLGSGDSAITFYKHSIKPQFTRYKINPKVFMLYVAGMERGKKNLERKIPDVSVRIWNPEMKRVFSSEASPLGYRVRMIEVRDMCYKYGNEKELCVCDDQETKKRIIYPLGYKNSQSVVVFPYRTPNNTVPVLWSSRNSWNPLFPRIINQKINKAKEMKKETAYMLSVARLFGYKKFSSGSSETMFGREFTFTTKVDFQLFLLMRLIRTNRPKVITLQIMGIIVSDYDELIKKAVEKGLIDDKDNDLTQAGIREYEEIMKKINSYQYKLTKYKKTINKSNNNIYIPITFRGKT